MGLLEFLVLLVIAAICGRLGQVLAGYSSGGWLMAILTGFIGAYIGIFIARELGLPEFLSVQIGGQAFPVIWSVIGATIFTLVIALLRRTSRGR
ncbi:hypothetical protein N836_35465 [Leptolyngbya sp. Heron Island J]|uniref:GlsB/YeaQ/YmgE family stress response membrane protein n=1 Tax=Leptolyngbya sp. Heron Island J TaxID=1385935 RepID=UPI0003B9F1E2|nr:hypothetical protein [Leptolyngbya sp. Heron Island J]ESA37674.1 hypothetical protein N836_35465 [Leptolyngbya sp. Heron Island J]